MWIRGDFLSMPWASAARLTGLFCSFGLVVLRAFAFLRLQNYCFILKYPEFRVQEMRRMLSGLLLMCVIACVCT